MLIALPLQAQNATGTTLQQRLDQTARQRNDNLRLMLDAAESTIQVNC
jgi:hypothetical protein